MGCEDEHSIAENFRQLAEMLGMRVDGIHLQSQHREDLRFDLTTEINEVTKHAWREFLRDHEFAGLAIRRPRQYQHCAQGVNKELSVAAWKNSHGVHEGALRRWHTGAYLTASRMSRHSRGQVSSLCRFCDEVENMDHLVCKCRRWSPWSGYEHLRKHEDMPKEVLSSLVEVGLVPKTAEWQASKEVAEDIKAFQIKMSKMLHARDVEIDKLGGAEPPPEKPVSRRLTKKSAPTGAERHFEHLAAHGVRVKARVVQEQEGEAHPEAGREQKRFVQLGEAQHLSRNKDSGVITCLRCGRASRVRLAAFVEKHRECTPE
eukprot:2113375-Amphidinium_carterae.1